MKISVIGTGAIGGYYGMLFANMGHDVHFLFRKDYGFVKVNGMQLLSEVHNNITFPKVNAYNNAQEMPVSDVVLICLKTTQNEKVLRNIIPYVATEKTLVVLIQNGLGMEKDLAKQFPELQIVGAVAHICAFKKSAGVIVHQDYGKIEFGNYNAKNLEVIEQLSESLKMENVPSSLQNLNYIRWKKLVWNMTFNGLSVVLDKTTNEILSDEKDLNLSKIIMQEVISAAKVNGVVFPDGLVNDTINMTLKMRPYSPSMKLDYSSKRAMELDYMYLKPILAAKNAGFEMKEAKAVYEKLCKLNLFA